MTFLSDIYTLESATIWKLGRNFLSFRSTSSRDLEKMLRTTNDLLANQTSLGSGILKHKSSDAEKSRIAGSELESTEN
jgi:hypothetical protein